MKIKPQAGTMRGVRVMRDPQGILTDPYMDPTMGAQFGYVVVFGEGEPAVFDGENWHPIYEGDAGEWQAWQMTRLQEQALRISHAADKEPVYAELAKLMGIPVQPNGNSVFPIPADSTFEKPVVVDYSKKAE